MSKDHNELKQPAGLDKKSEANTEMLSLNSPLEESKKREFDQYENSSDEDVEEVFERIKSEINPQLNE